MSTLLWKYFFENDVDNFRQVLARASYNASAQSTRVGGGSGKAVGGSPGATLATSPTLTSKSGKAFGWNQTRTSSINAAQKSLANVTLSRANINWRDSHGVTLLHHIASSTSENASEFGVALLQLPLLDLYVQDEESGWTALHRALYSGNITIARALMARDVQDSIAHSTAATSQGTGGLIKIKDREGNSPFDVYGASIASRTIHHGSDTLLLDGNLEDEENDMAQGVTGDVNDDENSTRSVLPTTRIDGDELFAFGSNKNFTLGFGDEDDRQFPERISLTRPEYLLRRFYNEYEARMTQAGHVSSLDGSKSPTQVAGLPAAVQFRSIIIQDVQLSKLHSAILTTDPEANLYMCGFGSGGRLGTGDETTRFGFININGGALTGKKVVHVGLGQNHTIAISSEGETLSWGSNTYGQLGYSPNTAGAKDEEPVQLLPRQIFGPLKRELVIGAAASRIHSVVHTANSLYTFGKNEGQLGLVDSDARSLAIQNSPRKVAASLFSSPIRSISAIDRATICLLENHDVWVFSNYGYTKMTFPLESFSNYFLKSVWNPGSRNTENKISKITSGGDTICAMSNMGDVFTVYVSQKVDSSTTTASATNPSKIRGALSTPQRVWSLKKGHMAVRDVDVSQDGSIIICTESGSVWRRVKRAKINDTSAAGPSHYKAKDYKFSRVPGLTRVTAVRSNTFGAYAAVRRDCDVLKTQVDVENNTLWKDLYSLLPLNGFGDEDSETENPLPRFWMSSQRDDVATIRRAVLASNDLEAQVAGFLAGKERSLPPTYNVRIGTTLSGVRIPVHDFMLGARSDVLRQAFMKFRQHYFYEIQDIMIIEYDEEGKPLVLFQGVDFLTIFNLVVYIYTDSLVDVWHHTRQAPGSAFRYRQVRTELMKLASHLDMSKFEQAVRSMTMPPRTLHKDFEAAISQPGYFDTGDVEVELDGGSMKVHSALMVQRCPFFEGLFQGRAAGLWLSSRREQMQEQQDTINIDLKHVDPEIFRFVLQHIYADVDEGIFDNVVTANFDAFLDLVLDVMSLANELMLDRLAQCCQKVLGRFVNTRNVCQLLNAVAPCSVTQFKDAALEYICLNLEGMLENHLLDELDEELMLELDEIVRQNQLACLPIAKSGRAEAELLDRYPELIDLIERSKRVKVDSIALQIRLHESEAKSVGGSKAKAAFLEDFEQSPLAQKSKGRPSRDLDSQSKSPSLRAKSSAADLMFEMDEDSDLEADTLDKSTPVRRRRPAVESSGTMVASSSLPDGDKAMGGHEQDLSPRGYGSIAASTSPSSYTAQAAKPTLSSPEPMSSNSKKPWGPPNMATSKVDMRDILAQASTNRVSNISTALFIHDNHSEASTAGFQQKLSQRERKKQHQLLQPQASQPIATPSPALAENRAQSHKSASPWQIASTGPKVSLKDVLGADNRNTPSSSSSQQGSVARTPSPLNLRQTVSGKVPLARQPAASGPTISPAAPVQRRTASTPADISVSTTGQQIPPSPLRSSSSQLPPIIQSIRHHPPALPAEPTLQLSMADILSQQQTEKDIIKEAVAKRSLQEIQEEQAFQEWWDEESRKVKAEAEEKAREKPAGSRGGRRGVRGKGRGAGGGGARGRGGGSGSGRSDGGGGEGGSSASGGGRGGIGARKGGVHAG